MDKLTNFIFEKIDQLDATGDKGLAIRYFGVKRSEITKWKRSKKLPFSAAAAVFSNEFDIVEPGEEISVDEVPTGELPLATPDPISRGITVPASAVRPSGGPTIVPPRLSEVRDAGIHMVQSAPAAPVATGVDATQLAIITQAVLAVLNGGNAAVPTPAIRTELPQGNIRLKSNYGKGWNPKPKNVE